MTYAVYPVLLKLYLLPFTLYPLPHTPYLIPHTQSSRSAYRAVSAHELTAKRAPLAMMAVAHYSL